MSGARALERDPYLHMHSGCLLKGTVLGRPIVRSRIAMFADSDLIITYSRELTRAQRGGPRLLNKHTSQGV
jgi:hypothetical protein